VITTVLDMTSAIRNVVHNCAAETRFVAPKSELRVETQEEPHDSKVSLAGRVVGMNALVICCGVSGGRRNGA
jgi:hypothetical protein